MKAARSFAPVLVLGVVALAMRCSSLEAPDTSIEGSVGASLADFPSMAAIEVRHVGAKNWAFFCSGVVLDEAHILTTLDCVSMRHTKYRVKVGCDEPSHCKKFSHGYETNRLLTIPVGQNLGHDIAILLLSQKIKDYGKLVKPARIADCDISVEPEGSVSAVGWGRSWYRGAQEDHTWFNQSDLGHRLSPRVRKVDVRFGSTSKCQEQFKPARIDSEIICTTNQNGNFVKQVDLGGPLFHGRGRKQRLVGLPFYPNANPFVFLDVTKFKALIDGCKGGEPNCEAVALV